MQWEVKRINISWHASSEQSTFLPSLSFCLTICPKVGCKSQEIVQYNPFGYKMEHKSMCQTYNSYLYRLKELINNILCSCIFWQRNSRSRQRRIRRRIDPRTTGCRCLALWLPSSGSSRSSKKPPGKNYRNRKASNCPNRTRILTPFKKKKVLSVTQLQHHHCQTKMLTNLTNSLNSLGS